METKSAGYLQSSDSALAFARRQFSRIEEVEARLDEIVARIVGQHSPTSGSAVKGGPREVPSGLLAELQEHAIDTNDRIDRIHNQIARLEAAF